MPLPATGLACGSFFRSYPFLPLSMLLTTWILLLRLPVMHSK